MKFEKLKPGMVVYDVHSYKMGNTMISTIGVWSVRILSVDAESRTAMVSWNGNKPTKYLEYQIKKLREKRPLLVGSGFRNRLATREEIAAHKAAAQAAEQGDAS